MKKIKETGADVVICPSLETRRLFINALESRSVETLYEKDETNYKLVVVTVPPNGSMIGKTLESLNLSEKCRIATVFRNGSYELPKQSFMFKGGDRVVVLGSIKEVERTTQKLTNVEVT